MDSSFDWGLAPEPQCGGGADWDGTSWARNQTMETTQKWTDNEDVLESFLGITWSNWPVVGRGEGLRAMVQSRGSGFGITWERVLRLCVRYSKVDLPGRLVGVMGERPQLGPHQGYPALAGCPLRQDEVVRSGNHWPGIAAVRRGTSARAS